MKKLYKPITDADRHKVATLLAAGVRPYSVVTRACVTHQAITKMQAEPGWPAIIESKKAALESLMRGDA